MREYRAYSSSLVSRVGESAGADASTTAALALSSNGVVARFVTRLGGS